MLFKIYFRQWADYDWSEATGRITFINVTEPRPYLPDHYFYCITISNKNAHHHYRPNSYYKCNEGEWGEI